MTEQPGIYGRANLREVLASIPPDPDTEARHRAQTLIKTETIRVVVVSILKGGMLLDHSAPGPITIHALDGRIEVSVDDAWHGLAAGELISLAPGVRHAVRCIEDGAFLLTIGVMTRTPDPGGHRVDMDGTSGSTGLL